MMIFGARASAALLNQCYFLVVTLALNNFYYYSKNFNATELF